MSGSRKEKESDVRWGFRNAKCKVNSQELCCETHAVTLYNASCFGFVRFEEGKVGWGGVKLFEKSEYSIA